MQVRLSAALIPAAVLALFLAVGCAGEKSPETGDSPKVGMQAPTEDVKTVVAEKKAEATEAGKYNCCLKHPCDQCLVSMGACPCGINLSEGKEVCHECKGGWEAGDGAIEGKKAEDVKAMPRGAGM